MRNMELSQSTRRNFIGDARLLMRIVADIGDESLPKHVSSETVKFHSRLFAQRMYRYGNRFAPPLREFLRANIPQERPPEVIYPFGGGDLVSALLAFPEVPELTTISLEQAGDSSRVHAINHDDLQRSLHNMLMQIGGMLSVGSNTSQNLSNSQRNHLPVQVISFLMGLAVHDYEPVAMYYFLLDDDGAINYLSEAEIAELGKRKPDRLRLSWCRPNFSPAFANVEIHYRHKYNPEAPLRLFRHIAASLHNGRFAGNTRLRKHLESKRQVSGLVKGASYLLWQDGYSLIRDYMLTHMPFIVSDSTGIPVEYATAAGFRIKTFGRFSGSFLRASNKHNNAFCALWDANPYIRMPSRFGYVDRDGQAHMMFSTRM